MTNKNRSACDTHFTSKFIKREDKTPLYKQLAAHLKQEIIDNYQAGDSLPAESAIAKDFGVNRHTIRRAINELMVKGYVMRHQGKRAEVLDKKPLKYALEVGKFTAGIQRLGKQSHTEVLMTKVIQPIPKVLKSLFDSVPTSQTGLNALALSKKILRKERLKSSVTEDDALTKKTATLLNQDKLNKKVDYLIYIRTLRKVENRPITIIDHYLNPAYIPDIAALYQEDSLHACIEHHYGYELIRTSAQISARLPTLDEANYLDCHSKQPLLIVDSVHVNKDNMNQIIEVSISHTRADTMTINI